MSNEGDKVSSKSRKCKKRTSIRKTCENIVKQSQLRQQLNNEKNNNNKRQCTECLEWVTKQHYARHFNSKHLQVVYSCEIEKCNKVYHSKDSLTEHTETFHGNKRYKCSVCTRNFIHKSARTRHWCKDPKYLGKTRCVRCCQRFLSDKQQEIHMQTDCGGKLSPVSIAA